MYVLETFEYPWEWWKSIFQIKHESPTCVLYSFHSAFIFCMINPSINLYPIKLYCQCCTWQNECFEIWRFKNGWWLLGHPVYVGIFLSLRVLKNCIIIPVSNDIVKGPIGINTVLRLLMIQSSGVARTSCNVPTWSAKMRTKMKKV